jgi:hypothetical protein
VGPSSPGSIISDHCLQSSLEQPALSPIQLQEGAAWRRLDGKLVLDPNVAPHDVKQDIITDCSLCASIVTCLEHRRRFRSSVILCTHTLLLLVLMGVFISS